MLEMPHVLDIEKSKKLDGILNILLKKLLEKQQGFMIKSSILINY